MTGKYWYTMDKAGVAQILKSEPVRSILRAEAGRKCAAANRILASRYPRGATGSDYAVEEASLTFTDVAQVVAATPLAKKDQRDNRTLDSINH